MPTYNYECEACDHAFEEFQSMSAAVLRKCPSCAKPKLKRLIGRGAGIIFKGGGFYETDYRSDAYRKDQKSAEDKSKPESKSKAKPDGETGKKSAGETASKKSKD